MYNSYQTSCTQIVYQTKIARSANLWNPPLSANTDADYAILSFMHLSCIKMLSPNYSSMKAVGDVIPTQS